MNSNELPPVEIPELADALQSHVDAREGGPGRAGLERYVVVSTYVRADGTAGLEVVTNMHDPQLIVDTLALGVRCVEPSLPRDEHGADDVTPDDEAFIEAQRIERRGG